MFPTDDQVTYGYDGGGGGGMQAYSQNLATNDQYMLVNSVPAASSTTSTLRFDDFEELLWMGTSTVCNDYKRINSHAKTQGQLTSFYGAYLERYSGVSNTGRNHKINTVVPMMSCVVSVLNDRLQFQQRTGMRMFADDVPKVRTASANGSELLLGCADNTILTFDIAQRRVSRRVEQKGDCVAMKSTDQSIVCARSDGSIGVIAKDTLLSTAEFKPHAAAICDFDVHRNMLVTCGMGFRQGHCAHDRFIMIYDLRTNKAQAPLSMPFSPSFVRFVPTYTDRRILAVSETGEWAVFELGSIVMPQQLHLGIAAIDVSSSKQCAAFADTTGNLHLFSNSMQPQFNQTSRPTLLPDAITPNMSVGAIDDRRIPLNVVPCAQPIDDKYFSDWPQSTLRQNYRNVIPLPPEVLTNVKFVDGVGVVPNVTNRRLNQAPYDFSKEPRRPQTRDARTAPMYRRVDIERSRRYLDTPHAYSRFNDTPYTPLACDPESVNSYVNSVLLMLHSIPSFAKRIESHVCRRCQCLVCEVSFVYQSMTEGCGHQPVYTNNLLRVLRTLPDATALSLLLPPDASAIRHMQAVQSMLRFLINQIRKDMTLAEVPARRIKGQQRPSIEEPAYVTALVNLISVPTTTKVICGNCKAEVEGERNARHTLVPLNYGKVADVTSDTNEFAQLVALSMCTQDVHNKSTKCEHCGATQRVVQRQVNELPNILTVDCNMRSSNDRQHWQAMSEKYGAGIASENVTREEQMNRRFAQPCRFGQRCARRQECKYLHDGDEAQIPKRALYQHYIAETMSLQLNEQTVTVSTDGVKYNLRAAVYVIEDDDGARCVAFVRRRAFKRNTSIVQDEESVPEYEWIDADGESSCWLLYNDLSVNKVTPDEVLRFDMAWKMPILLCYERENCAEELMKNLPKPYDWSLEVFEKDVCLADHRRFSQSPFVPLSESETNIAKGALVAIDAEFVQSQPDESERTDRNGQPRGLENSVARVTCVRGWDEEAVPFIDDYISSKDEVVDYVTKYSGIVPADLDPSTSTKHLTTLKAAILKLRYLIAHGVVFVGHGLASDFHFLGVVIPHEQVRDTARLYHLPNKRVLSLRFLAWAVLGQTIQASTHDSCEDARTALALYKHYMQMNSGDVHQYMQELYQKALQHNYAPPD